MSLLGLGDSYKQGMVADAVSCYTVSGCTLALVGVNVDFAYLKALEEEGHNCERRTYYWLENDKIVESESHH